MKLAITLAFFFTLPVSAAIYKCKDANNQTIYSSRKCADTAELFIPKNLSSVTEKNNTLKQQPTKPSVDIYITSWCPYCKKAMAYLRANNVAFNSYDIEKNPLAKAKKHNLDPNYSGVPLTVINGQLLKGFSKNSFEQALK